MRTNCSFCLFAENDVRRTLCQPLVCELVTYIEMHVWLWKCKDPYLSPNTWATISQALWNQRTNAINKPCMHSFVRDKCQVTKMLARVATGWAASHELPNACWSFAPWLLPGRLLLALIAKFRAETMAQNNIQRNWHTSALLWITPKCSSLFFVPTVYKNRFPTAQSVCGVEKNPCSIRIICMHV